MKITDKHVIAALVLISLAVVIASIGVRYIKYDPSKSGLLVYTWQVGELPVGFTHFGYQADSMIYLDIVQRMYKYGLIGYWQDPNITGTWELFRYYMVVILCRPLSHVGNLIVYGLWPDPSALSVIPFLSGIIAPVMLYLIMREFKFPKLHSAIGALLLLTNRYFLFEVGEALFDSSSIMIGLIAMYVWIRSKRVKNEKWVMLTQVIAILYRQSNFIIFLACLIYDWFSGELKNLNWYKIPVAISCILIPMYTLHLIGGWTFFTPGLIEVEYHGSILTKPAYFIRTWFIAFGLLGFSTIIGLVGTPFFKKNVSTELVIPIYLILVWIFNFAWAINMGRFWIIACLPAIYYALKLTEDLNWSAIVLAFLVISIYDPSYSIIATLLSGGQII